MPLSQPSFPPQIPFNDGHAVPQIGLGVWRTPQDATAGAVEAALAAGYRHVDTASAYENEAGVGQGIRASGVPRAEVFVTTKLWNPDQGYDSTLRAFDASMSRLEIDYLDLYLIHWPSPGRNKFAETWRAFIQLQRDGRVRSIGVSNFQPAHLNRLIEETGVTPAVNQIELHPQFQQTALKAFHAQRGIVTEAWSPLGQGTLLQNPVIEALARKHARTPAQVIVRWHVQSGHVVIPKSVNPVRIAENFDVSGFTLDAQDLQAIAALDKADGRIGPDPLTATF